ncbi:Hypothetical_protein [Hexamita inflata]|uniref:Hypothetical_protein n=1 Tax=Hexamita inflata TaxID=28002 RepID=A0AA86RI95_9EUKA|nr:Hypothetical protein HINF_LOCUS64692 [Hexamita inflata]
MIPKKPTTFLSNQISHTALSHVTPPHRLSVSSFGLMEFVLEIFLLITAFGWELRVIVLALFLIWSRFKPGNSVINWLSCLRFYGVAFLQKTICTFCCWAFLIPFESPPVWQARVKVGFRSNLSGWIN